MSTKAYLALMLGMLVPAVAATGTHSTKPQNPAATTTVHAMIHVTPGLWEVISVPKASGDMPMSPEEMAQIPPAQRARIMATMRSVFSTPRKMKECMTPEKLAQGFKVGPENDSCTSSVVSNTASGMEVRTTCSAGERGLQSADFKFHASGMTNVAGTTHMVFARGGRSMTVDSTITGRWLGADCGTVTDVEVEQ